VWFYWHGLGGWGEGSVLTESGVCKVLVSAAEALVYMLRVKGSLSYRRGGQSTGAGSSSNSERRARAMSRGDACHGGSGEKRNCKRICELGSRRAAGTASRRRKRHGGRWHTRVPRRAFERLLAATGQRACTSCIYCCVFLFCTGVSAKPRGTAWLKTWLASNEGEAGRHDVLLSASRKQPNGSPVKPTPCIG